MPALDPANTATLLPLPPLDLFGQQVRLFPLLVGIAIIVGCTITYVRGRQVGLSVDDMLAVMLVAVVTGFFGSHLVYIFGYHPDKIVGRPAFLFDVFRGMSSLGGFTGGTIGVIAYLRIRRLPLANFADVIAFGFVFAWIFGRIGCTVAFDHPGSLTTFPLGMEFPGNDVVGPGIRHNLGFYEVPWSIAVAAWFYRVRHRPKFPGWYPVMFVLAYVPLRFPLDFLRAADARHAGFTPAQWFLLALFAWCLHLAYTGARRTPSK
ncbi:MAG: prolipoprotein diacylglyceryl transferase [Gemmatimonadota bacterium]|nr:prolipoprotein diacylglyceryl transferase [Gemmatimonadota bacterium]